MCVNDYSLKKKKKHITFKKVNYTIVVPLKKKKNNNNNDNK